MIDSRDIPFIALMLIGSALIGLAIGMDLPKESSSYQDKTDNLSLSTVRVLVTWECQDGSGGGFYCTGKPLDREELLASGLYNLNKHNCNITITTF